MKHEMIQEKLLALKDGEIPPEERRELLTHLAACEDCRLRFDRWEHLQNLLAQAQVPASSEAFVFQVMEKIVQPAPVSAREARSRLFPRFVFPTLGYLFAAFLIFFMLSPRESLAVNVETVLLAHLPQEAQWTVSEESSNVNSLWNLKEETL